jgi:cytochrome c551/c552
MERASYLVTLAAALAATAVNANAQDIAAGHAFAREACYACHVIEPEERPRRLLIGPAFRDIANTSGMTAAALQVFLTTFHPTMPNLTLTPRREGRCDRVYPQLTRSALTHTVTTLPTAM